MLTAGFDAGNTARIPTLDDIFQQHRRFRLILADHFSILNQDQRDPLIQIPQNVQPFRQLGSLNLNEILGTVFLASDRL